MTLNNRRNNRVAAPAGNLNNWIRTNNVVNNPAATRSNGMNATFTNGDDRNEATNFRGGFLISRRPRNNGKVSTIFIIKLHCFFLFVR